MRAVAHPPSQVRLPLSEQWPALPPRSTAPIEADAPPPPRAQKALAIARDSGDSPSTSPRSCNCPEVPNHGTKGGSVQSLTDPLPRTTVAGSTGFPRLQCVRVPGLPGWDPCWPSAWKRRGRVEVDPGWTRHLEPVCWRQTCETSCMTSSQAFCVTRSERVTLARRVLLRVKRMVESVKTMEVGGGGGIYMICIAHLSSAVPSHHPIQRTRLRKNPIRNHERA